MKKQVSKLLPLFIIAAILSVTISSCGVKDSDVKSSVETALKANPDLQGITVSVKDGIATLTGEVKDEATKTAAETALKEIKGLKSLTNSITVTPPPVTNPVAEQPAVAADDPLAKNVVDAIKDNAGVKAEVKDGVVTLTGEIKKIDLPKLMQKLNALKPKKIENKLTIK